MADIKPRLTPEERLAKLKLKEVEVEQERQKVKAKIRKVNAEQRKDARKAINRKKYLLGAWVLSSEPENEIKSAMSIYLKTDKDRALFGLEPLPPEGDNNENQ